MVETILYSGNLDITNYISPIGFGDFGDDPAFVTIDSVNIDYEIIRDELDNVRIEYTLSEFDNIIIADTVNYVYSDPISLIMDLTFSLSSLDSWLIVRLDTRNGSRQGWSRLDMNLTSNTIANQNILLGQILPIDILNSDIICRYTIDE